MGMTPRLSTQQDDQIAAVLICILSTWKGTRGMLGGLGHEHSSKARTEKVGVRTLLASHTLPPTPSQAAPFLHHQGQTDGEPGGEAVSAVPHSPVCCHFGRSLPRGALQRDQGRLTREDM